MLANGSAGLRTDAPLFCVGAIVLDDCQRVFVMRRAPTVAVAPGAWEFVGGHVRTAESDEQAFARETRGDRLDGPSSSGAGCRVALEPRRVTRLERDSLVDIDALQLDDRERDAWTWVDRASSGLLIDPTTGDTRLRDIVLRAIDHPIAGRFSGARP